MGLIEILDGFRLIFYRDAKREIEVIDTCVETIKETRGGYKYEEKWQVIKNPQTNKEIKRFLLGGRKIN